MNSHPVALGLVLLAGAALGSYLSQVNGPFLDQVYQGIADPNNVDVTKSMAQTLYLSLFGVVLYLIAACAVLGKFNQTV